MPIDPTLPYDDGNIFAKILRGELPCAKVHEDDVALAFMDIMPRVEGHVLVIPKAPARTLLDIDPGTLGALMARVQSVGRAAVASGARRHHGGVSRRTYPIPRTVWISRGSPSASVLRRR